MRRVLVVTAVRAETRAVLAALRRPQRDRAGARRCWRARVGAREVVVLEGGVGGAAAQRAVEEARIDCDLLLSVGFAGALVASLTPGDLVVPPRVVWDDGVGIRAHDVPAPLHAAAVAALPGDLRVDHHGVLFSSPVIVTTPLAKAEAARRFGAVAVEMEAQALIAHAAARAVPLLAVRAVLDASDLSLEALPPNISTSWSARAALLVAPAAWPLIVALRRHVATASRTLAAALAALLAAPLRGE